MLLEVDPAALGRLGKLLCKGQTYPPRILFLGWLLM